MTGFIVSVFPFRNRVSFKEAFEGLELGERKLSRPVLRGPGGRKVAWLLGSNLHFIEARPALRRGLSVMEISSAGLSMCSNFVQVIQHFAARPQHYNTQRDNQKGGHFLISSWRPRASYAAASRSMSSA
jgi:hypothetical protein